MSKRLRSSKDKRFVFGLRIDKEIALIEKVGRYQDTAVGLLNSMFLALCVSLGNVLSHLLLLEFKSRNPSAYEHPVDFVKDQISNASSIALNMTAMQNAAEENMAANQWLTAVVLSSILFGMALALLCRYGARLRQGCEQQASYSEYENLEDGHAEMNLLPIDDRQDDNSIQ